MRFLRNEVGFELGLARRVSLSEVGCRIPFHFLLLVFLELGGERVP